MVVTFSNVERWTTDICQLVWDWMG